MWLYDFFLEKALIHPTLVVDKALESVVIQTVKLAAVREGGCRWCNPLTVSGLQTAARDATESPGTSQGSRHPADKRGRLYRAYDDSAREYGRCSVG